MRRSLKRCAALASRHLRSFSPDWRWRVMTAVLGGDAWSAGTLLTGRGNNTWPALHAGQLAFASTRRAQRLQRDPSQDIYLRPLP